VSGKLETDNALKAALNAALASSAASKNAQDWYAQPGAFLADVEAAIPTKLHDQAFLLRLWDDNPVSATGNGTVKVAPALADAKFRDWFADQVTTSLPVDDMGAETALTSLYDELSERLKALCGRTPRLKINRVLCAIYPQHFTSLADVGVLRTLHKEMGGMTADHPVHAHKAIRARIDAALGQPAAGDKQEAVRRVCLPWLLFERIDGESSSASKDQQEIVAPVGLKPLPATLRRKGLTAIKGGFLTLLSLLEDLREGVTKDEFASLMKQANPDNLAASSVTTAMNVVAREFDLCRREGDTYRLSARGLNLLETQDPDELRDHLLTRVLGVDNVLKRLEGGPSPKAELVEFLQDVNPGWTSDFAPTSLLGWLTSLELTALNTETKQYGLTDRGRQWAEMVTWTPQSLPKAPDAPATTLVSPTAAAVTLPSFAELSNRVQQLVAKRLRFEPQLLAQLHTGLWFHPVRHFAVLTGISGSGKTQLALNYALALTNSQQSDSPYVKVIPVQPGWYDPSPLLGYVSPIQEDSYRSAPFLELLLRATQDPKHPYVVILDEMNLSHPEQYLAPVLSAMETHGWLDLHQLGEEASGVPMRVQYPANLAIVGTVNLDETTHGLSDKVLDRAYTLEFWDIDVAAFPGWSAIELPSSLKDQAKSVLGKLVGALAPVRLHFGWRTIDDVLRYLSFQAGSGASETDALDAVIYAKVLPKLRGDTAPRFLKALEDARGILAEAGLKRCEQKLRAMQEDLKATGSARFWR
jgi:5-methylcytosine-specific restriction enzyme B